MEGTFGRGTILLEKYRIESVLGRGGMGVVLRVTHMHLGEELALKILLPEVAATQDVTARFLQEAQSAVRLRGEHVARVFDIGMLPDGAPYIVMEYLRGVDLAGELNRRKMLLPGEAVDHVLQACEALAEAHAHGIVHRDIKSANLFLTTRPDGTPLVKVLDFGISKAPISTTGLVTKTDIVMGTPGYMSPEQMKASKDVDARTDIWSLGIVLYECLSGRRPFEGASFSAIVLMAGTEPPPPMDPRIPRGLQEVVLRCLEKDRRARFSSIAELAASLAPFARDQRAATMVVERTNLMLQRQGGASESAAHLGQSQAATTLSGSAGTVRSSPRRRRYAIAGMISLIGSIIVLVAVTLSGAGGSRSLNDGVGIIADAGVRSPVVTMADGAAPPATAEGTDEEKAKQLGRCIELRTARAWRELEACASVLNALGAKDKARELHTVAKQETEHEVQARDVQQALHDQDLKKALTLLRAIGDGSVYFASLSDAFLKGETQAFDEAKRKAQSLAKAHDCAGLERYIAQMVSSSTDRVVAAAQAVTCVDTASPVTATEAKPPAGDRHEGSQPPVSGGAKNPCDTSNVDSVVSTAANLYNSGHAAAALALMTKAIACKQDLKMYRLAAIYACAAHDLRTAKLYFNKISVNLQAPIEQKCQQEGLNVRGP